MITMKELETIRELALSGHTQSEIARRVKRDRTTVSRWLEKMGLQDRVRRQEPRKCLNQSKCWDCVRSVEKSCAWAREFEPVEGWDAEYRPLLEGTVKNRKYGKSYFVKSCPEFVEG